MILRENDLPAMPLRTDTTSSPRSRAELYLVVLGFVAAVAIPGTQDSLFPGVPLSGPALAALVIAIVIAAFGALFRPSGRIGVRFAAALVVAAAIKAMLGMASVPSGWRGTYETFDEPRKGNELFLNGFSRTPFRIDRRIDFAGPSFNLGVFNDLQRYNRPFSNPRRDVAVPWRAQWTGFVRLEDQQALSFTVRAVGPLTIDLDGAQIFSVDGAGDPLPVMTRPLAQGPHEIVVTYTKPAGVKALAAVIPVSTVRLTPWLASSHAERRTTIVARAALATDAAAVFLFAWAISRAYRPWSRLAKTLVTDGFPRAAVWAGFTFLLIGALQSAAPVRGITTIIGAGDDPIAYEGNARDVALHGWLMPGGQPPGSGRPYFFYPFYSYALAGAHIVLGEDLSAAVLLNGASVASVVLLSWWLGWRSLRGWSVVVAVLALGEFCRYFAFLYGTTAFTDCFFLAMVFVALYFSRRAVSSWSTSAWLIAGVASAFAAATRPSFMTYPAILAAVLLIGWRPKSLGLRLRATGLLAAGTLMGFAPFAVRNRIMSGAWVLLVSSWIQIPYFLIAPEVRDRPSSVSGLPDALVQAWHITVAHPTQVLVVELRKLGFTFGMLTLGPPGERAHPEFIALSVLFVAALMLRRIPKTLAVVLVAFAISHVASMILAAPWTYGFKTIVPLHAVFLLGATFLLARKPGLQDSD